MKHAPFAIISILLLGMSFIGAYSIDLGGPYENQYGKYPNVKIYYDSINFSKTSVLLVHGWDNTDASKEDWGI